MNKQVMVTGANGFVGRHVINEFASNGYAVIAVGGRNTDVDLGSNLGSNVDYISVDLTISNDVDKLNFNNIEAVIHLAGLAAVGPSYSSPMNYISTNASLEVNIFEAAIRQGVTPRFLVISSGSLYDPMGPLPITERSEIIPSSPYAVSKITQEYAAHYYAKRGFEIVIARPFNHTGPGQGLGFLVPDLISQAIQFCEGKTNEISVGNLDAKRDYTDVRDIAHAYRLLIEKGHSGNIYNICSGTSRSGHEILDSILSELSINPKIVPDPTKMRPADVPNIYGSHEKISQHTGWQPEIDINTTISDTVNNWRI